MTITKRWLTLTITSPVQLNAALTDYLVGVFDGVVESGVEDHLRVETLQVFFGRENPSPEYVADLVDRVTEYLTGLAAIFSVEVPKVVVAFVEDEDWSSNWKKHFTPFAVSPGLIIKPTWETYRSGATEKVIEMDPGMAFGTGHHATTSLCLDFLREVLEKEPGPVLDVGTGTGILAMAAALFGAPSVLAIDNDPEAVSAARVNVVHNGLEDRVSVAITPLEAVAGSYRLVVANIIFDALCDMAPALARLTAGGGSLVLSGILQGQQVDTLVAVYGEAGLVVAGRRDRAEWAALHLVKSERLAGLE
ncbi:MAG: 50S ribosomal protein L11 methyltransferase [Desulfopila sp.]